MTIIEQADSIVGIAEDMRANEITRAFDPSIYRRGAYAEWFAKQDETLCVSELRKRGSLTYRIGSMPVEKIADAIVAVHAATRPKGDGLPEVERFIPTLVFGDHINQTCFKPVPPVKGDAQAQAMAAYLTRCLSAPVRRLLAEFEVADKKPAQEGLGLHRCELFEDGHMGCHYEEPPILWLVPKAVTR